MKIPRATLKLIGMNPTGDLGGLTAYSSPRAGTVWFTKSPPLTPATEWQLIQRNRFRLVAAAWRALSKDQRNDWNLACRRARLLLHGYQLWVWWQHTRDRQALATIERISALSLAP